MGQMVKSKVVLRRRWGRDPPPGSLGEQFITCCPCYHCTHWCIESPPKLLLQVGPLLMAR
jgi:hypothetical protein